MTRPDLNLLVGFAVAAVGGLIGLKIGLPQGALLGFIVVLLAVTVASSLLMSRFFGLDLATALFGTSPGALSGITAMARREGANAVIVAAIHTLRVVAIVVATPIIYRILVK